MEYLTLLMQNGMQSRVEAPFDRLFPKLHFEILQNSLNKFSNTENIAAPCGMVEELIETYDLFHTNLKSFREKDALVKDSGLPMKMFLHVKTNPQVFCFSITHMRL